MVRSQQQRTVLNGLLRARRTNLQIPVTETEFPAVTEGTRIDGCAEQSGHTATVCQAGWYRRSMLICTPVPAKTGTGVLFLDASAEAMRHRHLL